MRHFVIGASNFERENGLHVFTFKQYFVVQIFRNADSDFQWAFDRDIVHARAQDALQVFVFHVASLMDRISQRWASNLAGIGLCFPNWLILNSHFSNINSIKALNHYGSKRTQACRRRRRVAIHRRRHHHRRWHGLYGEFFYHRASQGQTSY